MKFFLKNLHPLQLSFWLLAIAFVAVLLLRIILVFSYIPETGGVSVNVLFSIVRLMNGYALYSDPQLPPYPIAQYMPLHYAIVSTIGKVLGFQSNIHAISVLNRFLCLAYDLLVFIPVYKILRNQFAIQNKQVIAAVCMSIFLVLPNPNYGRVDNLYLLSFMWSLYFFLAFISDNNHASRKLIYAGITVSFGMLTKQSGVFLLAATGLYLLFIHRNWNATFRFSLTVVLTCGLLFTLLVQNNFYAFYQNTVLGLNNGISINWFNEVIVKTFFFKMYFFVACGLALALLTFIDFKNERLRYLGFVSLIVFCCSLAASLKWGSSTNYFSEFLALTFILSAIYFTSPSHLITSSLTTLSLLLITPFFILAVFNDKGWGHLSNLYKSRKVYQETALVAQYLQTKLAKGDLVFTEFHKENLLNIFLYQYSLFPQREIVVHCTYPKHTFSYLDFQQKNRNGAIKFWVGKRDKQPTPFLNVDFNHFVADTAFQNFVIYQYIK